MDHRELMCAVRALWQVAEDMAEAAEAVRSQMQAAMKVACAEGIIIAMPALPGPPPRRDASQQELARFEDGALQLAAIAALSGVPQVRPAIRWEPSPACISYKGPQAETLAFVAVVLFVFVHHAEEQLGTVTPLCQP